MGIVIRNTSQGGRITFRSLGLGGRITSGWPVVSPSVLLLDTYPGAAAAYSLRKLRTAYNGSAIRVRRSNDNAETDIGFFNNELDTASLNTFVGANSGFITTWYDQSSNTRNITQATAGNQPIIVNAGTIQTINSKPAVYFDTTTKSLSVAYGFPGANSFIFDVLQSNDLRFLLYHGQSDGLTFVSVGNNADSNTLINANATVSNYYKNSLLQTAPTTRIGIYNLVSTNTQILLTHQLQLTSWPAFIISGYLSYEFIHYKNELIIYNTDQTLNRSAIESNINSFYTIY